MYVLPALIVVLVTAVVRIACSNGRSVVGRKLACCCAFRGLSKKHIHIETVIIMSVASGANDIMEKISAALAKNRVSNKNVDEQEVPELRRANDVPLRAWDLTATTS